MSCFLEIWFRGEEAKPFRQLSKAGNEDYYPHITLVRPFSLKSSENETKQTIFKICHNQTPISFKLKGLGSFDKISYIPVISEELLSFSDKLENALSSRVQFVEKLDENKTLHLTVKDIKKLERFPNTNFYMLRLTAIKNKLIWFSYDFVTEEMLDRDASLDNYLWQQTLDKFHAKIQP